MTTVKPGMSVHTKRNRLRRASALLGLLALLLLATGFTWPWERGPWPRSSEIPVENPDIPTLESRLDSFAGNLNDGFRFAAFGDQRALADGEWQAILAHLADLSEQDPRLLFALDTGDIVDDGGHSDQFAMLAEILAPIRDLPYLVCVGNHEVDNNRNARARDNTARFLSHLGEDFSPETMYYRKDVGRVRFLFLDTNDLLYGDRGETINQPFPEPGSRAEAQMAWLVNELEGESRDPERRLIAVMHHPLVQSSRKHREQAVALWSYTYRGRSLPHILLDGEVDMILTGHTHTFERFVLEWVDGRSMHMVNVSGRPRTSWLWKGDGRRRAKDIAGRELDWLEDKGWSDLEGWRIAQTGAMLEDESNQFGLFGIDPKGGIWLEMFFLDEDHPGGLRRELPVHLH